MWFWSLKIHHGRLGPGGAPLVGLAVSLFLMAAIAALAFVACAGL